MLMIFLPFLIALLICLIGYFVERYLIRCKFFFNNKIKIYDLIALVQLSRIIGSILNDKGLLDLVINSALFLIFFLVSFFEKKRKEMANGGELY